ncbi:MAG: endonuclease/exonuclease/phosphatase family protein, partial [Acidobacteria bacterium]|nr:endonuclease/exonuclease/phosphatase family protein [Acidobacteriota bacterium]
MAQPLSVLFWNLRMARERSETEVANVLGAIEGFTKNKSLDLLIFAESKYLEDRILLRLNESQVEFEIAHPGDAVVHIYRRRRRNLSCELLDPPGPRTRWNGYRIRCGLEPPFVLVATHSPSKLHGDAGRQEEFADQLREDLYYWLCRERHDRGLLCGDFNMNPCDPGLASFRGLQAVMSRADAKKERTLGCRTKPKLYNPMWRHWGGESLGTHYYAGSDALAFYWHTLDHVILTPAMLDAFSDDELSVPTNAGGCSLVKCNGRPREDMSDHLPILFQVHSSG